MADDLLIRARYDGRNLVGGLNRSGNAVSRFGGEVKSLGRELGAGIGLAAVTSAITSFTSNAIQAADETRRVQSAFVNLSGGAAEAAANMEAISQATSIAGRQVVDETERMKIANQLLGMNIASTADELEKVVSVSRRLGAEFRGMGAAEAANEFAIMISNMSVARLDSFGISSGEVRKRIDELMASTQGMTREQAFFQATMEQADSTLARLGPELDSIAAAAAESGAAFSDFQGSFGTLLTSVANNSGIFETFTGAMNKLNEGAQSWVFIVEEAIPAIREQRAEIDTWAGSTVAAANSLEEMSAATEGNISDFESFRASIASSVNTYDQYVEKVEQIKKVTAGSGTQLELYAQALGVTESEFIKMRTATDQARIAQLKHTRGVEDAAIAYENLQDPLHQSTIGLVKQIDPLQDLQKEWRDYGKEVESVARQLAEVMGGPGGGVIGGAGAGVAGAAGAADMVLPASLIRQAPDLENVGTFSFLSQKELAIEARREAKEAADEMARALSSSISDMASKIQGAVSQVSGLTFGEIMPPEETFRVDEWVRRAQAVANDMNNEWAGALQAEFGGQDFFAPVMEAFASGDQGAVSSAIQGLISGENLIQMMDIDGAMERAKEILAEQNLQAQINQLISEALMAEGEGGGEGNAMVDIFGTGLPEAIGTTGEAHTDFATNAMGELTDLDLALLNIGETTLPEVAEAHKTVGDEMAAVFDFVKSKSKMTGDGIKGDFDRAGNAMRANFPIANELVKHLERVEAAANRAASAIRRVRMGGGGGFDGFVEEAGARGLQLQQVP